MNPKSLALLILLAAVWGASFLFMRVAAPVLGPFATAALRVLIAGGVLLLCAGVLKHRPQILSRWRDFLILGALNAAVPFTLISAAEIRLPASTASILNSTTPLFTALVAAHWRGESLGLRKFAGILAGIAGVAVLVGWSPLPMDRQTMISVSFCLLAALSYGAAGNFASRAFQGVSPLDLAVGQQIAAGMLLLPAATIYLPRQVPSQAVILSVTGLAILSTAFAYLLYFRLIATVGPLRTLSVTYLIPVFGILWSALFLGEPVRLGTLLGLAIVLGSVGLVNGASPPGPRKRAAV